MDETKAARGRGARPVRKQPAARKQAKAGEALVTGSKKAAAGVRAGCRSPSAPADRDVMVRTAAFYRAERRGFAPGHELADWLAAESEVDAALSAAKRTSRPRKTTAKKPGAG